MPVIDLDGDTCDECGKRIPSDQQSHTKGNEVLCGACNGELLAGRPHQKSGVPQYTAVAIIAGALRVAGVLTAIAGIVMGVDTLEGFHEFFIFMAGIGSCIFCFGVAQIAICIRDMAINSYHIRNALAKA